MKFLSLFTLLALTFGCAHGGSQTQMKSATAQVGAVDGSGVSGSVTFTAVKDGMRVDARLKGLSPGKHGFHIHETGDCSDSAKAAGGHFNAAGAPHAGPEGKGHNGDLGNLVADKDGNAELTVSSSLLSFEGDHSILNRAVIVHGGEDDLKSQPAGAAGPRIGCGLIEKN